MKSFANETFYVDSLAMLNYRMVLNQQKMGKLMDSYMKHANNMDTLRQVVVFMITTKRIYAIIILDAVSNDKPLKSRVSYFQIFFRHMKPSDVMRIQLSLKACDWKDIVLRSAGTELMPHSRLSTSFTSAETWLVSKSGTTSKIVRKWYKYQSMLQKCL